MYAYPYSFLASDPPPLLGAAAAVSTSARSRLPPFPTSFPQTVPSACLSCRSKHLKCDGQRPCSRCVDVDSECTYVPSRRGYKGPSRKKGTDAASKAPRKPRKPSQPRRQRLALLPPHASASTTAVDGPGTTNLTSVAPVPGLIVPIFNPPVLPSNDASLHPLPFQSFLRTNLADPFLNLPLGLGVDPFDYPLSHHAAQLPTPRDQYMDYFYHYFYPTHPFVLPREYLLPLTGECNIAPLIAAMRWVGSLYLHDSSSPAYSRLLDEAYRLIYDINITQDGFIVQAMLLLIIGLDANRQREKVHKLLSDIEQISVQIGLNTRLFALANGRGMPIIEESWRRTWWDLYVVDAFIAGVHRSTRFLLYDVPTDVSLPCEEHQYLSGHIPQPLQLEDMNNTGFLGDGWEFSSFAYRVQCANTLGKLLRLPIQGPKDKNISDIRALLTNWQLHLPLSKRDVYRDGHLDEMMFQAYMMAHAISILLHQPFSQLDPSLTRYIDACLPNTPALSRDKFNSHTKHTIHAANSISHLITHRVPLLSHSHFFAYMITLAATVHLSEWTLRFVSHNDDNLRQRIRLSIGALDKYSETWPAAGHLGRQVKGIAQEVYRTKREHQNLAQQNWISLDEGQNVDHNVVELTDSSPSNSGSY